MIEEPMIHQLQRPQSNKAFADFHGFTRIFHRKQRHHLLGETLRIIGLRFYLCVIEVFRIQFSGYHS